MAGCQAINKMTAKFYSRKIYNFILFSYDLFFALMGVHSCLGFSLIVASEGLLFTAVWGLLIAPASLVSKHRL